MSSTRSLAFVAVFAAIAACAPSVEARRQEAQAALDAGDHAKALQLADAALPAAKDDAAETWRLEQIKLDALAATGKGSEVAASLERLGGPYAKQITSSMYRTLADKLAAAKDIKGATLVLEAGDKAFPAEHDTFAAAIRKLSETGDMDPAEVERLEALGYL